MSAIPPEIFRRWFDYERDAHGKVLTSLSAVPPEKRMAPEFRRAVDLMAHILGARWFWLAQIGATSERRIRFFSKEFPFADLPRGLTETESAWQRYLEGLTGSDLARPVEWGPAEGPRFMNTVEEVLTQLFGHSTYHRGQIALLLRKIGCEPPSTEFIHFARRPADPAPG